MLTGELPFQGSTTVGVLMARMLKPPPDPRSVNPELPEPVAKVVLRLLAQNREDRYRSADDVAAALRALLALPPSANPPAGADEPTRFLVADPAQPRRPVGAQRAAVALSPEPAPLVRKAVAVLPFTSQSAPPDEALLLDGLTDALIDALSGLERVRVLSRGAVTQPQLAGLSPRAAGEQLGAESVVHGSVRRVGDELIVSVRLISVKDGIQVMARRYQRPAARVYSVADEAAQALAQALAAPEQAVSVGPLQDPRIAELYVRARQSYHRSGLLDTRQSCVLFEQALAMSPHDPMLLSYCALAQARLWFFGGAGAGERAVQAAEQAVRLAPQRGEPFLALAVVRFQSLDSVGAIAAVREALARMPSLVDGYDIAGHILMEAGPLRSGLQYLEYALGLDPSLQRARIDMARAYALRGDWDQAEQQLGRAEAVGGSTAMWVLRARLTWWRHDRAAASSLLQRLNMPAELPLARRILEVTLSGRPLGTMDELFGGVMSATTTSPRSRIYRLQLTAEMFAYCGAREEALRTVEQAVIEAQLFDLMWLERCPLLAPLRKTARWPALRTQVEQRAASVHRALGWPTASTHPTARGG